MRSPDQAPRLVMAHASAPPREAEWVVRRWNQHLAAAAHSPAGLSKHQLENLRRDVAKRQQHPRPHEGRDKVRDLKGPERHFENAGDERDGGAQRPEEAPDENAERTPFLDEGLALRDEVRVA